MLRLYFDPFPDLRTERLVLRQLVTEDAQGIFMLRSNKEVNEFIDRRAALTIEDARQFIHTINENIANIKSMYWGIALKNDTSLIGTICYWNIIEEKQCAEIGYELHPRLQGKGLMQEAIQKVINFGFEKMQLEMITAFPHHANKKSITLLEKNNFSRDVNLEQEMAHDLNDYLIYSLARSVKTFYK